jgi:predicted nucleic acid-binding protein
MKLVVDHKIHKNFKIPRIFDSHYANILFSFFKKDSTTRRLLTSFEIFELYTPALCFLELLNHKEEICKKSGISGNDLGNYRKSLRI